MARVTLDDLAIIVAQRASASAEASYTRSLIEKGVAKCAQKLGEEAVETSPVIPKPSFPRPPIFSTIWWCCCRRVACRWKTCMRNLDAGRTNPAMKKRRRGRKAERSGPAFSLAPDQIYGRPTPGGHNVRAIDQGTRRWI